MRYRWAAVVGLVLRADVAVLAAHDGTAACAGYQASSVKTQHGAVVSADLTLAGTACNVYGTDLDNLKLEIEYQTGRV
ncbi:MAG: alpha-glucosidase [Mucilaginibacter sp.]|jgi:alpha-glucosidase|nr:alpha-glucosidase [Mucilaginibacter sp.]